MATGLSFAAKPAVQSCGSPRDRSEKELAFVGLRYGVGIPGIVQNDPRSAGDKAFEHAHRDAQPVAGLAQMAAGSGGEPGGQLPVNGEIVKPIARRRKAKGPSG